MTIRRIKRDGYEGYYFGDCEHSRRFGDGKWVDPRRTREKATHPYSYDEFFHFGSREIIAQPGVHGDYSDRLWQWDHAKMDRLWKKHTDGKGWTGAGVDRLSTFMSEYHGQKLRVVALVEGCNVSNGFPYFVVWYVEDGDTNAE